jgi:ribose 1,5-bisphosphokinase
MGTLFYVVGPSGVGKDTLLAYARARLAARGGALFAHRYITRPADAGGETHIPLSRGEYLTMRDRGLFALHWESHGNGYGIGREIDAWLMAGLNVVMNGSRGHLAAACERYPRLRVILVQASTATLRARLEARGREGRAEIEERVARAGAFTVDAPDVVVIGNNGPVAEAGERLLEVIGAPEPELAGRA